MAIGGRVSLTTPTTEWLAKCTHSRLTGRQFLQAGGNTAKRLAKWDGSQWTEVGGGITDGPVYSLATSSNDLFVGGDFTAGGSTPLSGVGKWDGSSWSDLVGGVRTGNSG